MAASLRDGLRQWAALWFFAAAAPVSAQTPVVLDEIVAKVNNEIITLTDLNQELDRLRSSLRQEVKDPATFEEVFEEQKKRVLDSMIETRMLLQKAEELGFSANIDVEVSAHLEEIRKQSGIPNMEVFDQLLRQRGSSLVEFRELRKKQLIVESLLGQYVYSKITLLTSEVEEFYRQNIQRFTEPAEVELAEILLLTEGKNKAAVRQRAEQVLAGLKSGGAFEELARQYSEGPTASRGGQIGSFKKGSMAAPLENVVFDLAEGETTGIIETDYGLQIVKVLSRKPSREQPLEEVRPEIQRELYQRKARPEMEEFMEELRSQSYIYVSPKYLETYPVDGISKK